MLTDAMKQLQSSLKEKQLIETFALLAKVNIRIDQPMAALKAYSAGLELFPEDVTMLTGMARVQEALGEYDQSIELYHRVLVVQANNIEVSIVV